MQHFPGHDRAINSDQSHFGYPISIALRSMLDQVHGSLSFVFILLAADALASL